MRPTLLSRLLALQEKHSCSKFFLDIAVYCIYILFSICSKQSDNSDARVLMANLCFDLGELCQTSLNDLDQAHAFYSEAIQYTPTHKKVSRIHALFKDVRDTQ